MTRHLQVVAGSHLRASDLLGLSPLAAGLLENHDLSMAEAVGHQTLCKLGASDNKVTSSGQGYKKEDQS